MLTKYKVLFTHKAKLSIESQKEFYLNINKSVAKNFVNDVNSRIESLRYFPVKSKLNKTQMYFPLRKFPFIIIYELNNTTIRIIDVFHTSLNEKYLD